MGGAVGAGFMVGYIVAEIQRTETGALGLPRSLTYLCFLASADLHLKVVGLLREKQTRSGASP
jgi:hypothetical protein